MKRTQLYLDEEIAKTLETLSRQKGVTISELVRAGLRERYMQGNDLDRVALARSLTGIWKNRQDLKGIKAAIRKFRKGSRLKRLQID
jgi:nuclear transport factor 2 (NTF2) superfamily protein